MHNMEMLYVSDMKTATIQRHEPTMDHLKNEKIYLVWFYASLEQIHSRPKNINIFYGVYFFKKSF